MGDGIYDEDLLLPSQRLVHSLTTDICHAQTADCSMLQLAAELSADQRQRVSKTPLMIESKINFHLF